jgi:hypothetical protein
MDGDPQIGQPTCWKYSREFLFLRSSDSVQLYWWLAKVAIRGLREIRMVENHTRIERRKRVSCWSGFPCRMYINSNRRDSWI